MLPKELFQLRVAGSRRLNGTRELRKILTSIFGEDLTLPVVLGRQEAPVSWQIERLGPLKTADDVTVRNYLCFLEEFEKREFTTLYEGHLVYPGRNSWQRDEQPSELLVASLNETGVPRGVAAPNFSLALNLSFREVEGRANKTPCYTAHSTITQTPIQLIGRRFEGPNTEYRD
jgi:hypothetical protein